MSPRHQATPQADPRRDGARTTIGLRGLVDLAFVLVLTGVALYGFRSTFSGQQYLLSGLVAAVIGVGVSSAITVWRKPVWVAAVLTVVAYFLFAGVLVFRDTAPGGVLPSADVLHDSAAVLADGWKRLLTTLPPVASDGRLLAIPYVLGLVSGAVATSVAQRTKARLLPALAPGLVLAAVILLGTAEPAARVGQGIVFGTVLVAWAAVRRPGSKPLRMRVTPGGPQRLVIGALVLAVAGTAAAVLQPHLAGSDRHRVVLRDYVKPPFDIAAYPSPLVGFRKYTKSAKLLYGQTLFTVRGLPAGTPVRLATLDAYDGSVWGATNGSVPTGDGEPLDAFQRVGSRVTVPATGRAVDATVTIAAPYAAATDIDAWVPSAGTLRSIAFQGARAGQHAESYRYNLATGSGITAVRLAAGDHYRVRGVLDTPALPAGFYAAGTPTVDPAAIAFVGSRANQWSAKAQGLRARIVAVGRYMRDRGAYSDGGAGEAQYLPGHSTGRLTSFLNAPQLVGDDEQYAAVYALMCNYLGVPARVVLVAEPRGRRVVQGKDVHTAVEVHVSTGGRSEWATIPRSRFMPDENKKPNKQPPQTIQDAQAAIVPPPNPVHPPSTLDEPDRPDQNTQRLGKIPGKEDGVLTGWFGAIVLWIGIPLLVVVLLCALIVGTKWRRRVLRRTRGTVPSRFDAGWREFIDAARDLGAVVPGGRTRHEQAEVLATRPSGDRAGGPGRHGRPGRVRPRRPPCRRGRGLLARRGRGPPGDGPRRRAPRPGAGRAQPALAAPPDARRPAGMTDLPAFAYSNLSGRRRGPALTAAGLVLRGIARVHEQVVPYADAWQRDNIAAMSSTGPLWVALGDSLTQGIGAPAHDRGWVGQLRERLPTPYRVVNLAVSGARVADLVERQLPVLDTLEPELVTMMIGSNDILRPKYRRGLVDRFAALLERLPAGTVVTTLPNPTRVADEVNRTIAATARRRGLVVAELRDPRTSSWRGKLAADHFHPNEAGYAALADVIGDNVKR